MSTILGIDPGANTGVAHIVGGELGIQAHGISPKSKGAKTKEADFIAATGWQGRSNEHTRDAAMVAWPYRSVRHV